MNNFGLTDKELALIRDILDKHTEIKKALIFGSRATGNYKKGSDIDLVICGNFKHSPIPALIGNFEESILPYFVDILEYSKIDNEKLKKKIDLEGKMIFER